YFRIRSIRFIAVNENFDTANPEDAHSGIIIPLRNMINEAYALDIGRKIRAQQRQAMKDGKFIGARTPYGYLKAGGRLPPAYHRPRCRRRGAADVPLGFRGRWPQYHRCAAE
ncbi:TnpX site-specific recombinase, partial [human gut metagenome]